jgi:hypothetical protein
VTISALPSRLMRIETCLFDAIIGSILVRKKGGSRPPNIIDETLRKAAGLK